MVRTCPSPIGMRAKLIIASCPSQVRHLWLKAKFMQVKHYQHKLKKISETSRSLGIINKSLIHSNIFNNFHVLEQS